MSEKQSKFRTNELLPKEQRLSPLRRQFNEAFCDENGQFSLGKFIAVWAQIVVLAHLGTSWDKLITLPETLLIVLCFLIAPHIVTKIANWKWGPANGKKA